MILARIPLPRPPIAESFPPSFDDDRELLGITDHHPIFRIGAYTFGGLRDIWQTEKISFGIGSDITFYSKPAVLDPIYGNNPVSWKLFLRVRPGKMDMSSMHTH